LHAPLAKDAILLETLRQICILKETAVNDGLIEKGCKLIEILGISQRAIIVGQALSGKSKLISYTRNALKVLNGSEICLHKINTKAITEKQLFGVFDENANQTREGVFTHTMNSCARDGKVQEACD